MKEARLVVCDGEAAIREPHAAFEEQTSHRFRATKPAINFRVQSANKRQPERHQSAQFLEDIEPRRPTIHDDIVRLFTAKSARDPRQGAQSVESPSCVESTTGKDSYPIENDILCLAGVRPRRSRRRVRGIPARAKARRPEVRRHRTRPGRKGRAPGERARTRRGISRRSFDRAGGIPGHHVTRRDIMKNNRAGANHRVVTDPESTQAPPSLIRCRRCCRSMGSRQAHSSFQWSYSDEERNCFPAPQLHE